MRIIGGLPLLAGLCLLPGCGDSHSRDDGGLEPSRSDGDVRDAPDADPLDAPACVPTVEECNGRDDDCDELVDEGLGFGEACDAMVGVCATEGTRACGPDGTASVCVPVTSPARDELCNAADDDCDGSIDESLGLGEACTEGVGACLRAGTRVCAADGVGTRCDAIAGESTAETCNSIDDDCDGVVDDGEICPDTTVRYAVPFFRSMYYVAQQSEFCGYDGLFKFWPVYVGDRVAPSAVGCEVDFRVWNEAGHFYSYPGGLASTESGRVTPIDTEPCAPRGRFGYANTGLRYQCGDSVYREPGVLVTSSVDELLGVMRDGRIVVRRGSTIVIVDPAGTPLGDFDLAVGYAGTITLLPTAGFDYDNDVFVLGLRVMPDGTRELVVLRADPMNRIRQVRRVPASEGDVTSAHFVLPDGTIFSIEPDPETPGRQRIRRRGGDGTDAVVFREADVALPFYIGAERRVIPLL